MSKKPEWRWQNTVSEDEDRAIEFASLNNREKID